MNAPRTPARAAASRKRAAIAKDQQRRRKAAGGQPLLARALETIANAIFITDAGGRIVWANAAFSRLSGYDAGEVLGHTPAFLKSGAQDSEFYAALWRTIRGGQVWQSEVIERHRDGTLYVVDEIITPLVGSDGRISHYIAIQHDITQRRQQAEQDRHLAYHDALTGLPNRLCFQNTLRLEVVQAAQQAGALAVLFIDLDKFKPVNDSYGHQVGDLLLAAVAARLRAVVRDSDLVARLGGDEFGVLLHGEGGSQIAATLADKLIASLRQPYALDDHEIVIGVSVGVARFPGDGATPEHLLEQADAAMYRAKAAGGNTCRLAADGGDDAPSPAAPPALR